MKVNTMQTLIHSARSVALSLTYVAVAGVTIPTIAQTLPPQDIQGVLSARYSYNPVIAMITPPPPDGVEMARALPYWVAVGNWKAVGAALEALPPVDASRVHARIVDGVLAAANKSLSISPSNANGPQSNGMGLPPVWVGVPLAPNDVLDLAEALPKQSPFDTQAASQLGRLFAKSVGPAGLPQSAVDRLRKGAGPIGGSTAERVPPTVIFLLAAERPDLAKAFLPSQEDVFKQNSVPMGLLYQQYLIAAAAKSEAEKDTASASDYRRTATRLTLSLLGHDLPAATAESLLNQALRLSEQTGDNQTIETWLADLIQKKSPLLPPLFVVLANPIPPAGGQANYNARVAALTRQQRVAEMIRAQKPSEEDAVLRGALNLFAMAWATEADFTRSRLIAFQPTEIAPGQSRSLGQNANISADEVKEIPPEQLLMLSPEDGFVSDIRPADLTRFCNNRLALFMATDQMERAKAIIAEMARSDASTQSQEKVVGDALKIWAAQNQTVRIALNPFSSGNVAAPKGIPTARVTQERNLDRLAALLQTVKTAYGRPLPGKLVTHVFASIYSQAEVYSLADIERIFGPLEQLDRATVIELTGLMQSNLAKPWMSDQVQRANGTGRSDDQTTRQVIDGYATLGTILEKHLALSTDWRLLCALASARFKEAELRLKQGDGFSVYSGLRDKAFDAIHRAADEYASHIGSEDSGNETLAPYTLWFALALGATDLSAVEVNDVPSMSEIERLRDALRGLPKPAWQRHINRLASLLNDQLARLAPDVKERIVRNGLTIVSESPLAAGMQDLMRSYSDLLTELKLDVAVDGPKLIGTGKPVGIVVSAVHTDRLATEIGGFGKFILSANQGNPNIDGRRVGVDYRGNFEAHLRDSLGKNFDIQSIVWAPEDTAGIRTDRAGWSRTPLTYVVVKAKNPSIDRIPPVQFDVDFNDKMNLVILPVTSSVSMVDATAYKPQTLSRATIDQRVNDHDLAKGILKLEINASGRGIVPELDQLVDTSAFDDFDIQQVTDSGVKVDRFDTRPDDASLPPAIVTQRSWTLTLQSKQAIHGQVPFRFAGLTGDYSKRADVSRTFHRYSDADVIEAEAEVLVQGILVPAERPVWPMLLLGCVGVFGVAVVVYFIRRRKNNFAIDSDACTNPTAEPGLFTLLSRLRYLREQGLSAIDAERISTDIQRLESDFFSSKQTNPETATKYLQEIQSRWFQHA